MTLASERVRGGDESLRRKKALPRKIVYLELLDSMFDGDGGSGRARSRIRREFPWVDDEEWEIERWGLQNPRRQAPKPDPAPLRGFALPFRVFPRVFLPVLVWIIQFVFGLVRPRTGIMVAFGSQMAAGVAVARVFRRSSVLVIRIIESSTSRSSLLYRHPIEARILRAIERFALRRADLVLPIGPFTAQIARRSGVAENRILEVPFPLSWNPSETANSDAQDGPLRVVAAARLVPEKAIDVLILAFAEVADEIPSVLLEIAGDGPQRANLEQLTTLLRIEAQVKFRGWLPASMMPTFWEGALIAVLPSRVEEGFGRVLVEGGLAGCALVGSELGGIKDIVKPGRTGTLVPPNDPATLAEALRTLLRAPDEARRLGANARTLCLESLHRRESALPALRARFESLRTGQEESAPRP